MTWQGTDADRAYAREYRNVPEHKLAARKYQQAYRNSSSGKEVLRRARKKYNDSAKGRDYFKNYRASVHGKEIIRKTQLKYSYNISIDEYNRLFEEQHGRCAICNRPQRRRFHIDHSRGCCPGERSCGKCIRGLLCFKCNAMLGLSDESVLIHKAAIRYLEKDTHGLESTI